jgi:hypothetical protein
VFIGSGDLYGRKATAWSLLKAGRHYNKHLQREWNEFNEESFKFVTLFEATSSEDIEFLPKCEEYWISLTKATDNNYGYNIYKKPSKTHDFLLRIEPL